MRYNLTLDDNVAELIAAKAAELKIPDLDYIRQVVTDSVGCLKLKKNGFTLVKPKKQIGYCFFVNERAFFLPGRETVESGGFIPLGNCFEVPQCLLTKNNTDTKFLVPRSNNSEWWELMMVGGAFTAVQLAGNECLLAYVPGGVTRNCPTTDTAKPIWNNPDGRGDNRYCFVVPMKIMTEMFEVDE